MGITAGVAAGLSAVGMAAETAAVVAPIVVGVGSGALIGAGTAAITGGNIGMGALTGGLTGGLGGVGGVVGGALGGTTGATIGGTIGGAVGGAAGAGLTGGNPLTGALTGGVGGYLGQSTGFLSPLSESGGGISAADYAAMTPEQQVAADIAGENAGVGGLSAQGVPDYAAASSAMSPEVQSVLYGSTPGSAGGALSTASGAAPTKGMNSTQLALGALAGVGQMLSKPTPAQQKAALPGPASTAATAGPLFNAPLQTSANINRTAVAPPVNYYNYGQGPEQTFFANNQLRFAQGGALTAANDEQDNFPRDDEHERLVRAPGDGTSDSAGNVALSDGEYVLTASDVARIGNGSNDAGARKLDEFRSQLADAAGQKEHIPAKAGKMLGKFQKKVA